MSDRPGILITRPEDQLDELSALVAEAGGHAVPFPLMRIEPAAPERASDLRKRLSDFRLIIFVSRNAVTQGMHYLVDEPGSFPGRTILLAVGAATARELESLGVAGRFPERSDSEGLLEMEETRQVAGQRVLIVRGVGGRELLADTLRERGALVEYLEVYRRVPAAWTSAQLRDTLIGEKVRAVMITSAQNLEHFHRLMTAIDGIEPPVLLLSSGRLTELAREMGYAAIRTALGAENARMVAALAEWLAEN